MCRRPFDLGIFKDMNSTSNNIFDLINSWNNIDFYIVSMKFIDITYCDSIEIFYRIFLAFQIMYIPKIIKKKNQVNMSKRKKILKLRGIEAAFSKPEEKLSRRVD